MQMADEFPDVEVTGCDLAPIQPEYVQSDSRSPPFSSFPHPTDPGLFIPADLDFDL